MTTPTPPDPVDPGPPSAATDSPTTPVDLPGNGGQVPAPPPSPAGQPPTGSWGTAPAWGGTPPAQTDARPTWGATPRDQAPAETTGPTWGATPPDQAPAQTPGQTWGAASAGQTSAGPTWGAAAGPTPAGPTPAGPTASTGAGFSGQAGWRPGSTSVSGAQPGLVLGIILVVVGAVLLALRLADVALGADAWPLWIVVPGVALLVASFAIPRGGVGLAIPGAMLTMVGIVLTAQRALDAYATWAYAWALVAPTGVGLGMLAYGAARRDGALVRDGLRIAGIGLALFAAFALFFEGVLGLSGAPIANVDTVLPYAAIGFGVVLLLLSLLGSGRRSGSGA